MTQKELSALFSLTKGSSLRQGCPFLQIGRDLMRNYY